MRSVTSHDRTELDVLLPLDELFPFEQAAIGMDGESIESPFTEWCSEVFSRLDPREVEVVRQMRAREPIVHLLARFFNDFGAGWIYPILALAAIAIEGSAALVPTGCAALAIAIAQSSFPFIKKHVRRERPLAFDPSLDNGVRPLDRWAWPSGHSIAAAAFTTPFVLAGLVTALLIVPLALGVLWSRLALGHHYPTDVLGGTAMGSIVGIACWLVVF